MVVISRNLHCALLRVERVIFGSTPNDYLLHEHRPPVVENMDVEPLGDPLYRSHDGIPAASYRHHGTRIHSIEEILWQVQQKKEN